MSEEFYVDKSKVEKTEEVSFYDRDGENTQANDKFFLKVVKTSASSKYFILFNQSAIVDPLGDNSFQRNYHTYSLKKIGPKAGELYLKYLKTKNQRYLTLCRRDLDG
jgi:hypothetical protein